MRVEASPIWFPGWREVLHPSKPVAAAGQAPLVSHVSQDRGLAVRVLGVGRLNTKGWKSMPTELKETRPESTLHHLGLWKLYRKLHHPQVSKK